MKLNEDFFKRNNCIVAVGETSTYTNGIFQLNEPASEIYDLIADGKNKDEIAEIFLEEYDSDISEIREYIDGFIKELREAEIIIDD